MSLVVVAGALANKPGNGGAAWTRLGWPLGLKRLGFDVFFIEQISATACTDVAGARCGLERSINLAYFTEVTRRLGLEDSSMLILEDDSSAGKHWNDLVDLADQADLLINISGHLAIDALKYRFRTRVFIDQDPGYTQFWRRDGLAEDRFRGHHFYFTVGANIGAPDCPIPTGGIEWRATRQPIVLEQWPVATESSPSRFTTIGSWRGPYGRVIQNGLQYGLKAHEFRKFMALPTISGHLFEIALAIDRADDADVELLRHSAWTIVDPQSVACDPFAFRHYVQSSGAEFSVAQGIYVETRSGWFSDRTVRYLASGKPALVQDTGFSRNYPTGYGLVPFRTLDEAVRGADRIVGDYPVHSRAARAIAEEFFDSDKVLAALLRDVGVTS